MDFCRGVVIPADRNFHHLPALTLDQEEQFGVKPEAPHAQEVKSPAGRSPSEKFQPALRVADLEARQEPHEQGKATASELAEPRLVDSDQVPLEGRSEERRGGEEGRTRWSPDHLKKKK